MTTHQQKIEIFSGLVEQKLAYLVQHSFVSKGLREESSNLFTMYSITFSSDLLNREIYVSFIESDRKSTLDSLNCLISKIEQSYDRPIIVDIFCEKNNIRYIENCINILDFTVKTSCQLDRLNEVLAVYLGKYIFENQWDNSYDISW